MGFVEIPRPKHQLKPIKQFDVSHGLAFEGHDRAYDGENVKNVVSNDL